MGLREQYDRDGYVLVPGAASPELLKQLRVKYLFKFLEAKTSHDRATVEDTVINDPVIRSFIAEGPLHEALKEVFGAPFLATPYSSVDHNRYTTMHTDVTGQTQDGQSFFDHPEFRMATIGIYLQEHKIGGLDVVPGSQNQPEIFVERRAEKYRRRDALKASLARRVLNRLSRGYLFDPDAPLKRHIPGTITPPMNLGDAIIFNLKVYHGGNQTEVRDGHKLAIFYKCGAKNEGSEAYARRVTETNEYLRSPERATRVSQLNATAIGLEFR